VFASFSSDDLRDLLTVFVSSCVVSSLHSWLRDPTTISHPRRKKIPKRRRRRGYYLSRQIPPHPMFRYTVRRIIAGCPGGSRKVTTASLGRYALVLGGAGSAVSAATLLYYYYWPFYLPPLKVHDQENVVKSIWTTTQTQSTACEQAPSDVAGAADATSAVEPQTFVLKEVYDIEDVLGQGAYGMVYKARRKTDGLQVALKAMPREYTGKTDFEREVAALQLLSRPPHGPNKHVVQLYDLHRDDKNYYLAMEMIEGGELFEHLIENGPYTEQVASTFLRQFGEAVKFVHDTGLCHADLKPENLMMEADKMSLKLVDFGCTCTHDMGRKELQLPAEEFALGCKVLHQAALGNQFELQRILLEQPTLVNFRDYDKRTPLHIAASEGHLDLCRYLVERGAIINRQDRWGGTPMDDAHRHGHSAVLRFLGERGGNFASTSTRDQTNHFIAAASEGNLDEVKAFIAFGDVDLDKGDYDGRRPIHLAASEGRLTVVKLLCEAGADPNVEDRWGNRPIDDAKNAKQNSDSMVKLLKQFGAKSGRQTSKSSLRKAVKKKETQPSTNLINLEEKDITGTVAYWAPELFEAGAKPTPAADMWAVGVIVYILLTGT
jgi:serine/threonine protein kinase